ncbi:MAG TPA: response regulator [Blastocatellia bacterium]|nr:response regulator [Blastocatellia bacterium]
MGVLTTAEISRMLFPSPNVLVIEDDKHMADALQTVLEGEGFNVTLALSGGDGLLRVTNGDNGEQFDLVLLDVMLPDLDGWTVLSRLRASAKTAHLPIIMLTAVGGERSEIELLAAGADDYIQKPFSFENLIAHINALCRRSALQSINPLTGLPGNRQVERFLQRCAKQKLRFWAAAYADIDNFKAYNDCYGFLKGDEVLKTTADLIVRTAKDCPHEVFIGNIGGDDFLIGFSNDRPREDEGSLDEVRHILGRMTAEFDRMNLEFYNERDLERGYLEAESRRGGVERYPLMAISIAVVTNTKRLFNHPLEISNILASVKRKAKSLLGSVVCFDQRKR